MNPAATKLVEALAVAMARLDFVEWDRTVGDPLGVRRIVFGWIARSDGDRDFVTLETWTGWGGTVSAVTSSAKHSREISRALGYPAEGHIDCEPVASVFDAASSEAAPRDIPRGEGTP